MTNLIVTYSKTCVLKYSKSCDEARPVDTLYVWCKLIHDDHPMWAYMYFWLLTIHQRGSSYICLYFRRQSFSKIKEKCWWQSLQTLHVMEWLYPVVCDDEIELELATMKIPLQSWDYSWHEGWICGHKLHAHILYRRFRRTSCYSFWTPESRKNVSRSVVKVAVKPLHLLQKVFSVICQHWFHVDSIT